MSQTEEPTGTNDWGDESEDSQADAPRPPPTIEELKAAAAAAQESINSADAEIQKAAAAAAAVSGNHQPHAENQNQHRAKKAQKTKGRVKINVPTNEAQGQQAAAAQKKKQKHQPEPVADEEDEEEDEEEEEPSKLIPAIVGCFQTIGSFIRKIFQFIGALFMRVFGLFVGLFKVIWKLTCRIVPLLAGVPLYCLILYLTSEYVVTQFESDQQLDMSCRLDYLLRCHAFTLLPVLLGLVVSSQKTGASHQRFYHESYEQVVLLIVNTLIMTAHCSVDQLHWIWCITIGYLTFSLPYWISLAKGGEKLQSTLRSPIIVTNVALILYNVVVLSGQHFGYFVPEAAESQSRDSAGVDTGTQTSPDDYMDSSGYSWWYFLFPPGLLALIYQNHHIFL